MTSGHEHTRAQMTEKGLKLSFNVTFNQKSNQKLTPEMKIGLKSLYIVDCKGAYSQILHFQVIKTAMLHLCRRKSSQQAHIP